MLFYSFFKDLHYIDNKTKQKHFPEIKCLGPELTNGNNIYSSLNHMHNFLQEKSDTP